MILVDSSIWVEALRASGDKKIKEHIAHLLEEDQVCTCSVVKLEILGAARKHERQELDSYFSAIPSLAIKNTTWEKSILLSRKLRDVGLSIPYNDILIISTCLESNLKLYCKDSHFNSASKYCKLKIYSS